MKMTDPTQFTPDPEKLYGVFLRYEICEAIQKGKLNAREALTLAIVDGYRRNGKLFWMRNKMLAEKLGITKSGASKTVSRLVEAGMLTQIVDQTERRFLSTKWEIAHIEELNSVNGVALPSTRVDHSSPRVDQPSQLSTLSIAVKSNGTKTNGDSLHPDSTTDDKKDSTGPLPVDDLNIAVGTNSPNPHINISKVNGTKISHIGNGVEHSKPHVKKFHCQDCQGTDWKKMAARLAKAVHTCWYPNMEHAPFSHSTWWSDIFKVHNEYHQKPTDIEETINEYSKFIEAHPRFNYGEGEFKYKHVAMKGESFFKKYSSIVADLQNMGRLKKGKKESHWNKGVPTHLKLEPTKVAGKPCWRNPSTKSVVYDKHGNPIKDIQLARARLTKLRGKPTGTCYLGTEPTF